MTRSELMQSRSFIEAGLIGLFFVQALRFVVATVYARVGSASIYPTIDLSLIDPVNPVSGLMEPSFVTNELTILGYVLLLPLLAILLGRFRWLSFVAVLVASIGRVLMTLPDSPLSPLVGGALTIGGGLLYIALLIRYRPRIFPYFFVLALTIDQLFRAYGDTLDPSLSPNYSNVQIVLTIAVAILSLFGLVSRNSGEDQEYGLMSLWGGMGLGGILFLQLSMLASPNALAGRAGVDYTLFTPPLLIATILPIVPAVRATARRFILLFDGNIRGWSWMLFIALLVVFGLRVQGIAGGIALVIAQFSVMMMFWWFVRPQSQRERNFTGLWLIFAVLVFGLFVIFDMFTYEYAYVREFADPFLFLNPILLPLLRGFRGLGLGVLLLAVFFSALPMIQTNRRIPWNGDRVSRSILALSITVVATIYVSYLVRPPVANAVRDADEIRIATYNIHAGYNEFFHYDLEAIARTIAQSGANVVLLQEIEAGRLTSFGVDQPLWLARRVSELRNDSTGMDVRFYPTNEGLQGLAVLSNVEIVFDAGFPLTSIGNQTGLQWVQVRPDEGIVTLYNTWLGLLFEGRDDRSLELQEQDQQRQLSEIFNIVSANSAPSGALGRIVIGGTFNNVPDSDLIQQMKTTGLVDPFESQPANESVTLVQTGREARLDYLWTNMPALGAVVVNSRASDHALAVVAVQLNR